MGFKGVATPLMTFCLFFVTKKEGYKHITRVAMFTQSPSKTRARLRAFLTKLDQTSHACLCTGTPIASNGCLFTQAL